jgi:hypothetical protein
MNNSINNITPVKGMIHEVKHFSKYLERRPNVHEETEAQHRTQNVENKHKCTLQKAKPREIQYKVLNEGNKICGIIPGQLTVKRKGKDAIGNN